MKFLDLTDLLEELDKYKKYQKLNYKFLEYLRIILYNIHIIKADRYLPEMFGYSVNFEPTFCLTGFLYYQLDVKPPLSGRQKIRLRLPT